jgi:hypothetical protein
MHDLPTEAGPITADKSAWFLGLVSSAPGVEDHMAIQLGSGAYVLSGLQVICHVLGYSSRPALLNQVRAHEAHTGSGNRPNY